MLVGRLLGASLGSKVSSKTMLATVSSIGIILVLAAILSPTTTQVAIPALQTSATGALSFGMAQVPINAMFIVIIGICTSIMWGSIFNLSVEGLGRFTPAASGIFMTLVCGGGILPGIQGAVADLGNDYLVSYWVIFIGLAYLLYYALIGSKNVNKDISTTDVE